MNLPNKLTIMRIILVPFCMFFIAFNFCQSNRALHLAFSIVALLLFVITSLTDMLDGKIARKYNLVTDFGKFLDPVADKLLIIGSYLALLVKHSDDKFYVTFMFWCLYVIFFRELAVTSLRMIVSSKVVIAADIMGKIKTVSQVVAISTVFLEPVVQVVFKWILETAMNKKLDWPTNIIPLTWLTIAFSLVMTVWSGINYIKSYWKYLDPEK